MAYEEGRKLLIAYRSEKSTDQLMNTKGEDLLTSQDFAVLGASSKLFAVFLTYPYQVCTLLQIEFHNLLKTFSMITWVKA
jgi:solute carrier family 25 folate transporter 32